MKYIDYVMNKLVYFIIFLGIIVAGGCSTEPVIKTVTQIELKPVTLPSVLLKPCVVATPPDQEEYIEAPFQKREEMLTNYTLELLGNLKVCNSQINHIKMIHDENIKLYQPKSGVNP